MPTLNATPLLLNSVGEPGNGIISIKASAPFATTPGIITTAAGKGVVRDGVLLTALNGGPLSIPVTPAGVTLLITLVLSEWRDGQIRDVVSTRTVTVPNVTTLGWSDLVDVVPLATLGLVVDPVKLAAILAAGDVTNPASAAAIALSATFAPIKSARPGNLCVFLGDSVTAGSDDTAGNAHGEAWPVYAAIISKQRIRYVRNAGVPGNTTAQMLARFDTDVTPYAPTVVTLMCGTNDTGVTSFATWQGQVQAIVAKIRGINAVPILCTMPPNNLTTPTPDRKTLIVQWNAWLRLYAGAQGIPTVDMYSVLADPANGSYLAAYYNDGTHPNAAGHAAMGQKLVDSITPILAPYGPILTQDDNDEPNAIYKGCFTGYSGTTLPSNWIDSAGTPTGSALSYITDALVPGLLFSITSTASSGLRQITHNINIGSGTVNTAVAAGATSITVSSDPSTHGVLYLGSGANAETVKVTGRSGSAGAWVCTLGRALRYAHAAGETVVVNGVVGDKILFTGIMSSDGGAAMSVGISPSGSSATARAASNLSKPIVRGVFLVDYVIAAGTTNLNPYVQIPSGATGVLSVGQMGFYNLTQLGLA